MRFYALYVMGFALLLASCSPSQLNSRISGGVGTAALPDASMSSPQAFELTLFGVVNQNCVSCHGNNPSGPPQFADSDPSIAHLNMIASSGRVNFENPEQSLIVEQVRNNHKGVCDNPNWGSCEQGVSDLIAAIREWKRLSNDLVGQDLKIRVESAALALNQSVAERAYIPTMRYLAEAESGTRSANSTTGAPAANTADPSDDMTLRASGGQVVTLGAANANVQFPNLPTGQNMYAYVRARARQVVGTPATAQIANLVNGAGIQTAAFEIPQNDYKWVALSANNNPNNPRVISFTTPGSVTVQRGAQNIEIDMFALSTSPFFTGPESFLADNLNFDISQIVGAPATLKLQAKVLSDGKTYSFSQPRLVSTKRVRIKNMKILINDKYIPQSSAYTAIDTVVEANSTESISSAASTTIGVEISEAADRFKLGFEVLREARSDETASNPGGSGGSGGDLAAEAEARFLAAKNILQARCMTCHGRVDPPPPNPPFNTSFTEQDFVSRGLVTENNPGASELIQAIRAINGRSQMPPPPAAPLSNSDIQIIENWIQRMP